MIKPRLTINNNNLESIAMNKYKEKNFDITNTKILTENKELQFCSDIQNKAKFRVEKYCNTKAKDWTKVKPVYWFMNKISYHVYNIYNRFY